MKDIKVLFGKISINSTKEDIKKLEDLLQEKVNEGYKIVNSNISVSEKMVYIYALVEKEH